MCKTLPSCGGQRLQYTGLIWVQREIEGLKWAWVHLWVAKNTLETFGANSSALKKILVFLWGLGFCRRNPDMSMVSAGISKVCTAVVTSTRKNVLFHTLSFTVQTQQLCDWIQHILNRISSHNYVVAVPWVSQSFPKNTVGQWTHLTSSPCKWVWFRKRKMLVIIRHFRMYWLGP